MRRWQMVLGWLSALLALGVSFFPGVSPAARANDEIPLGQWVHTTTADFAGGLFAGISPITMGDGGLRIQGDMDQGSYTSIERELEFPCRAAGLLYRARIPDGASISFQLRARGAGGEWSPWFDVSPGPWTDVEGRSVGEALTFFPEESVGLQYRVTLARDGRGFPILEEVVWVYLGMAEGTGVEALPPWRQTDGLPHPVAPTAWGGLPSAGVEQGGTIGPLRVEFRPATVALSGDVEPSAALQMLQRFHRDVLGFDDLLYAYLVDPEGGIYEGRGGPAGDILTIGVLGSHPYEPFSPTTEDALLALLDWWGGPLWEQGLEFSVAMPADPALVDRILARQGVGNLRRGEWLLPRGETTEGVHEWILLLNPADERARVTTQLHGQDGRVVRRSLRLSAGSRSSLFANALVAEGQLWAQVQTPDTVLVERAVYYGHDGDDSIGLDNLSQEWYLPGGTQEEGFSTTLTLLNPHEEMVTATVAVFAPNGLARQEPLTLAPQSRLDLPIAQVYTGSTPVGCWVTAGAPIAVEQGVRFAGLGGGYGLPGTPVLSQQWTLAGLETQTPFVTVLGLLNPHDRAVTFTLTLMSEDGTTLQRRHVMQPGEQQLNLNDILPELALGGEIQSDLPIAVARVTFFNELRSAHAALGVARPARHWYLPEGATADPFETYLLVANPNEAPSRLEITFMGGQGVLDELHLSVPAHARLTVLLNDVLPDVSGFGTRVESEWPVVVERSMYMHDGQGGHSSTGISR